MSVAIVTGASQGFGRALAEELAHDGWDLVVDARHQDALEVAAAALRRHGGRVVAIAGDVADPVHRDDAGRGRDRARRARPARQQRQHARPVAAARPRRLPARRAGGGLPGQRRRSAGARPAGAPRCCAAARRRVVNVTSDAAVEGYEGWGGYGSSKAALEQLSNVLAAEEPDLRVLPVRSGRHAHADAPGRVPGRGHLRSPGARDRRPGAAPTAGGRSAERSLPGRRPAGGAAVTAAGTVERPRSTAGPARLAFDLPPELEAAEPPEARGLTRDAVRMMVAHRRLGHHRAQHVRDCCPPSSSRATSSSSTPRARSRPRSTPSPPTAPRWSSTSRPSWTTTAGSSSCAGRPDAPPSAGPVRRPPSPLSLGAGRVPSSLDAPYGDAGGCGSPGSTCPQPHARPGWPPTAGRSATATSSDRGRSSAYQNVYATEPGSAEMPSAGRPFTPEVITRLVAKGVGVHPARAAHRRRLARGRRAALPRARPRARRRRPTA